MVILAVHRGKASACLFKEDSAKRRTALIFSWALSVVLLPEAIKKLYNIKKSSGYPKFFVAQALTYVFLENFRDSSWIGVQPQENQFLDGGYADGAEEAKSDNQAKDSVEITPMSPNDRKGQDSINDLSIFD